MLPVIPGSQSFFILKNPTEVRSGRKATLFGNGCEAHPGFPEEDFGARESNAGDLCLDGVPKVISKSHFNGGACQADVFGDHGGVNAFLGMIADKAQCFHQNFVI